MAVGRVGSEGADAVRVAALLTLGGDERIAIQRGTEFNPYGCGPRPQSAIVEFSSSTASTISTSAFDAAARRFATVSGRSGFADVTEDLRLRLGDLCALPPDVSQNIILAPSGTDLHLIAADLSRGPTTQPLLSIIPDPRDTGRGVPDALRGLSYAALTPHGGPTVREGAARRAPSGELLSIPLRMSGGALRPSDAIDHDVDVACERAIRSRRPVLLVLLDVSKTGLIAPSAGCARRMKRRYGDALTVLVDACQFRLSPETLRDYLDDDFLVAVTGSKFLGGPAFSGALLVPSGSADRLRRAAVSPALGDHCARAEWPKGYVARAGLRDVDNLGLLLRWEAALHELAHFRSADPEAVARVTAEAGRAVQARLAADPAFEVLAIPGLPRANEWAWDAHQTIFPFLLRRDARLLSADQTRRVQMAAVAPLAVGDAGIAVRLGQPVPIGQREGTEIAALRLAFSARQLAQAAASPSEQAHLIALAGASLDRVAHVARCA